MSRIDFGKPKRGNGQPRTFGPEHFPLVFTLGFYPRILPLFEFLARLGFSESRATTNFYYYTMTSHNLECLYSRVGQLFRIGLRSPGVVVRTQVVWDESVGVGTLLVWMDPPKPPAPAPAPKIEGPAAPDPDAKSPPHVECLR